MIEFFIITVLVLWSSIVVFKNLMPKTANKTYTSVAHFCEARGWHSLASKIMPKKTSGSCGGGCGCGVDDGVKSKSQQIKTVKWK